MITKSIIKKSVHISLIIQLLTGIISLYGIFIKLPKKDAVLTDILIMENIVQFVEAGFYIYIASAINNMYVKNITRRRYFDWMITTPTMIISTILFMNYKKNIDNKEKTHRFFDYVKSNKTPIIKIVIFNFFMLLFGYFGEVNILDKKLAIFIGFIFFGLSFNTLYQFTNNIPINEKLFYFMFIVWGLYGIAALFDVYSKNLSYNILDIISKNFYGLFIFYKIIQTRKILDNK